MVLTPPGPVQYCGTCDTSACDSTVLVLVGQLLKRQRGHILHRQPIVYCSAVRVRLYTVYTLAQSRRKRGKNEPGGAGGGGGGGSEIIRDRDTHVKREEGYDSAHGAVAAHGIVSSWQHALYL